MLSIFVIPNFYLVTSILMFNEGMNAVKSDHEVNASARVGQAGGDQQSANVGIVEAGKLNEVK